MTDDRFLYLKGIAGNLGIDTLIVFPMILLCAILDDFAGVCDWLEPFDYLSELSRRRREPTQ